MKSDLERFGFLRSGLMILIVFVAALHGPTIAGVAFAGPGARILEPQELPEELKPGAPIERELTGGKSHSYRVHLTANQFLSVVVNQKGIDVVLRVFGPDEQKLTEVDNSGGPETVFVIAETSGEYRVEVRTADKEAIAGAYEISITELREATPRDRIAVAAETLFEEGNQLRNERTVESRRKALKKYEEALLRWREAGDRASEAQTLNEMGVIYANLSDPGKAVKHYSQAVTIARAAGARVIEANTLTNMGTTYWRLGESQKALEHHKQALSLARAVADFQNESLILSNTGAVYWSLGQPQESLKYYNQALVITRAHGNRRQQAITLNNIAASYQQLGELQQALESLTQVIALRRALGDREGEAAPLNNLGLLQTQLGNLPQALEYYSQALELKRASGDRQGQATNLQGLSGTYSRMGELGPALKYGQEALELARAVADARLEAYVVDTLGKIHKLSGEPAKALASFELSLNLRRKVGDRYGETYALSNIANSHLQLGNSGKAMDIYLQALAISRDIGDQLGTAAILYGLARSHSKMSDNISAREEMEEALAIIESTRVRVPSQDLRSSFFASYQEYFQFHIDLLMRMHGTQPSAGHDAAALQANERARARTLLEILTEASADIRQGVDVALLERERSSQLQLNIKSASLTRLLSASHTEEQETAARKEVAGLLADYQEIKARIRATSPRYAALTQPQPLSLKEIQQLLDGDTLLLEYALGEERSYLWAVTPTSIKSFELPKRTEIETAARRVYDLLVTRADTLNPEALSGLSQMLLEPVADQLGRKRLLIVGQGALQYVPFGALPRPSAQSTRITGRGSGSGKHLSSQSLVVHHEIVTLPSASVIAVLRRDLSKRPAALNKVAVLADPVFGNDDQRVKSRIQNQPAIARDGPERGSGLSLLSHDIQRSASDLNLSSFDRLPVSRSEAAFITAMVPRAQVLQALDFSASRATATSAALGRYQIVHFATHSLLNNQHPELSGIVLSLVDEQGQPQDGFLRLHDIYNLNLKADLVVLSACQTALGKEIKGEGLIGLTRGFMYAGAPRVVASLWKVSDAATAELMKRFYQKMFKEGLRPAAALRDAQVSMLKERQWAAPYYWAGFVLQGEWQ